jgi:hypothetical protein
MINYFMLSSSHLSNAFSNNVNKLVYRRHNQISAFISLLFNPLHVSTLTDRPQAKIV